MHIAILCMFLIPLVLAQNSGSGCQQHRNRELNSQGTSAVSAGRLIPECDSEGNYQGLQCHPPSTNGQRFCQCWEKDGTIVTSPSRKTKACECLLQRNQATTNRRVGAFTPQCQDNGNFASKQCHASTGHCWCVNNAGEQQGERTRNATALTC